MAVLGVFNQLRGHEVDLARVGGRPGVGDPAQPRQLPVDIEQQPAVLRQPRARGHQHPHLLGPGQAPVAEVGRAQVEVFPEK